jgi:hypothetical protein
LRAAVASTSHSQFQEKEKLIMLVFILSCKTQFYKKKLAKKFYLIEKNKSQVGRDKKKVLPT